MSAFYNFEVIASTRSSFVEIGNSPSLNDKGEVAFVGKQVGDISRGIFVSGGALELRNIRPNTPGDVTIHPAVQINNSGQVISQYLKASSEAASNLAGIYIWDSNGQPPIPVASGGLARPTFFDPFWMWIGVPAPTNPSNSNFFDFSTVFAFPSLNNKGNSVVSAAVLDARQNNTLGVLATPKGLENQGKRTFNQTELQSGVRPMIADTGEVVVRFGRSAGGNGTAPSPIVLLNNDLSPLEIIAGSAMFNQLGLSPGISSDGKTVTFYGEPNAIGASSGLGFGAGIFASIKTEDGWAIRRVAGISENGSLDPGEIFNDINGNGTLEKGEDIGPFYSFDPNSRVGVERNSDKGFITYVGNDKLGKEGIFVSSIYSDLTVSSPELIVRAGTSIKNLSGVAQDLNIYDPINNQGEVAFWVKTDTNEEAVIKASPIRRPVFILPGIGATSPKEENISGTTYLESWALLRGVRAENLVEDPHYHTYDDLIKTLENVGYKRNEDLFVVNYDWRLPPGPIDGTSDGHIQGLTASEIVKLNGPNTYAVEYLGEALLEAAKKWEKKYGQKLDSVDVIAHSTGGLVARTYIQSDAYGGDTGVGIKLPKIDNLIMFGVPNRGASKAMNPLNDNWGFDIYYKYEFALIMNFAYQKVKSGKVLRGLQDSTWKTGTLTRELLLGTKGNFTGDYNEDGFEDNVGDDLNRDGLVDELDAKIYFTRKFDPTKKALLATYDFIDDGSGILKNVNLNKDITQPDGRNSLLLDLNYGLDDPDVTRVVDPNLWADKVDKITVMYGTNHFSGTPTTVSKRNGPSGGIFGFFQSKITPFDGSKRVPNPGEVWYEDNIRFFNGDGTVPLESSEWQFKNFPKSNIVLKPFTRIRDAFAGGNTEDLVEHSALLSNVDAQKTVLKTLGVSFTEQDISSGKFRKTALLTTRFASIVLPTGTNAIGFFLDPVEAVFVDATGKRFGYTQATGAVSDFANGVYYGDQDGLGLIFGDVKFPLQIELTGLGGNYYIQLIAEQDGNLIDFSDSGFLAVGERKNFLIQLPLAQLDVATTQQNKSITIPVLGNDSDPSGNPIYLYDAELTSSKGGTIQIFDNTTPLDFTDDQIIYTPATGFTGLDTFLYRIDNGTAIAVGKVEVNVSGTELQAVDDDATTDEDVAVNISVLNNDSNISGSLFSLSLSALPTNGTAVINDNDTPANLEDDFVIYSPNLNFNGTDSFAYTISDGKGGTATATVTIAVTPVNDSPTLINPLPNQVAVAGEAFTFTLPDDSFVDVDAGDGLIFTATLNNGSSLPNWITFDSVTRTFSGTSPTNFGGALNLGVTATDSAGASASSNFELAILKTPPILDLFLDLRDITGEVAATFTVNREAAFDNFVGFYRVTDINGGIDINGDSIADITPGQSGYTEAALGARAEAVSLTTANLTETVFESAVVGGSLYAPFLIANGNLDRFNSQAVFFAFGAANADGVEHIRFADGALRFEDLFGGGDNDFNDMVVTLATRG